MFGTCGQQNPFDITIPKRNIFGQSVTFGQPQPTTQPLTFGQSQPLTFGQSQPLTFGQPQPLTFGQPQPTTQPLTFGQPQPLTFGQPQPTTQPLTFGQPQPTTQPLIFGQSQPTTQPLIFDQSQPTTQPVTFGQPQHIQSVTFGQPQTAVQPLIFGQSQPTIQPVKALTFSQSQPVVQPFKAAAPIHEYSMPKTIVHTRVVYDIGTRQNYDHMSGDEYLLQNNLSLSIDYCEKMQREFQTKKNRRSTKSFIYVGLGGLHIPTTHLVLRRNTHVCSPYRRTFYLHSRPYTQCRRTLELV